MSIQFDKSTQEEILSKIMSMGRNSQEFHKKYVKPYTFSQELCTLRITYLNRLDEIVKFLNLHLVQ